MCKCGRKVILSLSVLVGLVVLSPKVRGASLGIHSHRIHQEQSSLLPPLHERLPAHVPHFSNPGLVRFWTNHQFSPILRDPGIQMQLCMAVSEERALNPTQFDRNHPLVGHLLRDPAFFQKALDAYRSHPARFVHFHHHLIPLIRGCALMMANQQTPPAISPETVMAPGSTTVNPVPEDINNGPAPNPPPIDNGGNPPVPVPAPPSIVLMTLGLGYLTRHFRHRRPQTPIPPSN